MALNPQQQSIIINEVQKAQGMSRRTPKASTQRLMMPGTEKKIFNALHAKAFSLYWASFRQALDLRDF